MFLSELVHFQKLGVSKVEIGIQHTDDSVLITASMYLQNWRASVIEQFPELFSAEIVNSQLKALLIMACSGRHC